MLTAKSPQVAQFVRAFYQEAQESAKRLAAEYGIPSEAVVLLTGAPDTGAEAKLAQITQICNG